MRMVVAGNRALERQQTLGRLERELGDDPLLASLAGDQVSAAVTAAWAQRAPATWNRHVATVRSFIGYCRRRRWLVDDLTVDLERRPEPADRTNTIPLSEPGLAVAIMWDARAARACCDS
jgi:hypothetical protein